MPIKIDLTEQLESQTFKKLQRFFSEQSAVGVRLWKNEEIFQFDDGEQFYFTHSVLQRNRKEGRNGSRYEIIAAKEPLCEGSFGSVYEIEGTLQFREDNALFKPQGKDGLGRVLCVEHSIGNAWEGEENKHYLLEAAGYLGVKEPVLVNRSSFLVMKRPPKKAPPITIDLTQPLESETLKKLQRFFSEQSANGIKLWKPNEIFQFDDGEEFYFTHMVLQRNRKEGNGVRYEVIPQKKPLGEGTFGTVYEIEGTLQFREDNALFRPQGKDGLGRALKYEVHTIANPMEQKENEYRLLKAAGHLGVKAPVLIDESSYLVMNRLPEKTLFEVLDDDRNDIEYLTTEQRLNLSNALLLALKEQVTSKGIVHRDIKPENIFVDMDKNPIKVTIIDYGLSFFAKNPDGLICGTKKYVSPETYYNPDQISYKSDIYSMARVIALVWGVNSYDDSINWSLKNRLEGLFSFLSVEVELRNQIYVALSGMLKIDPENRYSIDQAITKFPTSENAQAKSSIGRRLMDLLHDDHNNKKCLTIEQRLGLSNALLNAVEHQLSSKGRVHGGLNPSTIFVDLDDSYAVTILDYGLGFDEEMGFAGDIPDGQYIAPEFINGIYPIDNKVDVYSIALILAFIWHIEVTSFKEKNSQKAYLRCASQQQTIPCLGIKLEIEFQIKCVLQKMLKINPQERCSIKEAIAQFPSENKISLKSEDNKENKECANKRPYDDALHLNKFFNKVGKRPRLDRNLTLPKLDLDLPIPELGFDFPI